MENEIKNKFSLNENIITKIKFARSYNFKNCHHVTIGEEKQTIKLKIETEQIFLVFIYIFQKLYN
jgi:hypothetical protein